MSLMDLWLEDENDPEEGARTANEEEVKTENEEGAKTANEEEKAIIECVEYIKQNQVEQLRQWFHKQRGKHYDVKTRDIIKNILVYLAFTAEKDNVFIEEDIVKEVLDGVAPFVNVRRLTATLKWENNEDDNAGIIAPAHYIPEDISRRLLQVYFEREIVPASRLMLYAGLNMIEPEEEMIGEMFRTIVECAVNSLE